MAGEGFSSAMGELIRGLGQMSEHVQSEAAGLVRSTAEVMAARVRSRYTRRTGTLQDRVMVEAASRGQESAGVSGSLRWKVRSRAPHAHLYERGTIERVIASTGASRGRMPAKPTFVPEAVRARARMRQELIALVQRQTVPHMTGRLEVRAS